MRVRTRAAATVGLAGALTLAACGSSDTASAPESINDIAVGVVGEDSGTAVDGGEIAYSTFSDVDSLDPVRQDGGSTGGSEMAAIYDLLMRYDTDSDEYLPQLAQSLDHDDDYTEWTLTLRDGAVFDDGSPVDAEAVAWSFDRYVARSGTHAQLWQSVVETVETVDERTLRIRLTAPWQQFPAMLTTGPGMIVAPSSEDGDEFAPVGAGPFTVEDFRPGVDLVLAAREDYWDGRPQIDRLSFPVIVSNDGRLESLQAGDIDVAFLRESSAVSAAAETEDTGFVYAADMGVVTAINQREGRAAEDERVRGAIVAALDPELFDERGNGGKGDPGTAMFQDWSRWHTDAPVPQYDPDLARALLDEAKADGYDGHLTYAGLNAGYAKDRALTVQTMLESVGFTVDIELNPSLNELISAMYVKHDFDIGESGFNVAEEAPLIRLFSNLSSASSSNVLGLASPEADALLTDLQLATSDDERSEAIAALQEWVTAESPFAVLGSTKMFIPWRGVTGIVPSADGILLFGGAARTK